MFYRCVLACYLFSVSLFSHNVNAEWHNARDDIMGTRVSVELWHEDGNQAQRLIASVMSDMRKVEADMSPYIASSYVSKLNEFAAKEAVVVSEALFGLIKTAINYSELSDGAFDISFSSIGRFYDYRQEQAPGEEQIDKNLPAINYQLIELNKANRSIRFSHPDLKIDLGGIAKGYAVDRAIDILRQSNVSSAIVSAGGDSRILGDRKGTPWVIGIQHPRKEQDYAIKIPLSNTAISTSGDYERFFLNEKTGERVHHIINPSTGKSAKGVQSVSILSPHSVDADALSTTVFVLGIKSGLKLVNELESIDAIIIDSSGKLHYSDGLLQAR